MKVVLKGTDCALIFREDGSRDAAANDLGGQIVSAHVLLMTAILCRLKGDPVFETEMIEWMEAQRAQMVAEEYN